MRLGEFRITGGKDGLWLIVFGPRDIIEARAGVPSAAFALWHQDRMQFSPDRLSDFLNAAMAASHGDYAPMNHLCPPKADAA